MVIVTFIVRTATTAGSIMVAYNNMITDLEAMQSGGELVLIEKNIAQINLITHHQTFTNLVERCKRDDLTYKFSISDSAPDYIGWNSSFDY
jgi:hypothetical protein